MYIYIYIHIYIYMLPIHRGASRSYTSGFFDDRAYVLIFDARR